MTRFAAVALLNFGMLVAANVAAAQGPSAPETSRVELWGALTGVATGPEGSLTTSYSPPLLFDGDFTSSGGQTLNVATGRAAGFTGGIDIFPTRYFGFQVAFDRAALDVSGANTPYAVALRYESRPPPDNTPRLVDVSRSTAWPDTAGSLTLTTVAFNAVVRLGPSRRVGATISGGPAIVRVRGNVQPVGYTTFRLGGHSVLFEDQPRLAIAAGPENALGFNAGGEIDVAIGRRIAIMAGYRYFGGSDARVAVSPSALVNPDEIIFQQPLADIASRLALDPMRISLSSSRVFAGLRLRL